VRANFPRSSRLHRAPRTVVGHHGCSGETAERILTGERFVPSRRAYDWLGEGIYFWEYGPYRAYRWAERRFDPDAAVLQVTIRLGRCLNLSLVSSLMPTSNSLCGTTVASPASVG
jgi:hypothetical protein